MGKIMAVNISERKGTQKKNIHSATLIEDFGIEKDAHAGKWHRQVSLLSYEKIEEFKAKGAPIDDGAFGENLIVSGYDLKMLPVGTRLRSGDVLLEVTQIGKQCHNDCAIRRAAGSVIQWYGLDTSSVIVEQVPLVIPGAHASDKRIERVK